MTFTEGVQGNDFAGQADDMTVELVLLDPDDKTKTNVPWPGLLS